MRKLASTNGSGISRIPGAEEAATAEGGTVLSVNTDKSISLGSEGSRDGLIRDTDRPFRSLSVLDNTEGWDDQV